MWYELSKINPTSVFSAIYNKPVSVQRVGDAFQISDCITVDQNSVSVQKSMKTKTEGLCYSRPKVAFKFVNGTDFFEGQLGQRNEILLTTSNVENCKQGAEFYFFTSNSTYYYKDYIHVMTYNLSFLPTIDSFIALNLSFIENIDFKVIELYSSSERKLASAVDLETMFREYNYYTNQLTGLKKDLDDTINFNRNSLVQTFSDVLGDLGNVGKVIVNTVSVIFSFLGEIMVGIINFLKNPFGFFLLLLVVGGIILLIFVLRRRTNMIYQAPIRAMYPTLEQEAKEQRIQPMDPEHVKALLLGMHQLQQEEVKKKEAAPKESLIEKLKNGLRQRRGRGGGAAYEKLKQEDMEMGDV
uniref:Envelope glycoprotein B n=1 Tax=Rousettus bat herpesvirus TaxID=3141930 RepID=A0AAU7E2A6_9VIRU